MDKGVLPFRSAWLLNTNKNILDCILFPQDFKGIFFIHSFILPLLSILPLFPLIPSILLSFLPPFLSSFLLSFKSLLFLSFFSFFLPSLFPSFLSLCRLCGVVHCYLFFYIETASPEEQAFKDKETTQTLKEFTNSHSQDSESTFCLDDFETLELPNHEESKASPNKVNEASSLEWVCEEKSLSPIFPRIIESRNSYSNGSENGVHLKNGDDDDDDSTDDDGDNQTSQQLKSKKSSTVVKEANCLEWNFDTFEDEGSSPPFHRLKDFRSISAVRRNDTVVLDDKTLGPESLNSKALDKTSRKGKSGPGLTEELTKTPIPSQNEYILEKVNTDHCQEALSPVISSQENTKTSSSPATSSHRGSKKTACSVSSSEGNKKLTPVKKKETQNKNSMTRKKDDRDYMVQDEELFDETDTISLISFTGQDATTMLPSSVSLRELEIPTHVFHSSMHDGKLRMLLFRTYYLE